MMFKKKSCSITEVQGEMKVASYPEDLAQLISFTEQICSVDEPNIVEEGAT